MSTATKVQKTAGQKDGIVSRPILFSAPMVRAILSGSKTITRRVMKRPKWAEGRDIHLDEHKLAACFCGDVETDAWIPCPFAKIAVEYAPKGFTARYETGRRLWVRETWSPIPEMKPSGYFTDPKWIDRTVWYAADNDKPTWGGNWRPSIFMPREACRLTLEITGVRAERLQDITEDDAKAEGFQGRRRADPAGDIVWTAKCEFRELWEKINGHRGFGWNTNPWVYVVEFKKV